MAVLRSWICFSALILLVAAAAATSDRCVAQQAINPASPPTVASQEAAEGADGMALKVLLDRLRAAEAALAAERAAHARTRALALEGLRAAVEAVEGAGRPRLAETGASLPNGAGVKPAEAAKDEGPARLPLPAPLPFSHTVRAAEAQKSTSTSTVVTGSAEQGAPPLRARLEQGQVKAAAYTVSAGLSKRLVAGREERCYDVRLLDPNTGRAFTFDRERYVLVEKDRDARASYEALMTDVVKTLPAGVGYRLYVAAGASSKRFSRSRNVSARRNGLTSVTYYAASAGAGAEHEAKAVTVNMPQKYEPKHLPLLRADNVREIFARGGDVSRLELLEGRLYDDDEAGAHTFALYLCVGWPD